MSWVGGDAGQDIRRPGLRIDAIHFGRDAVVPLVSTGSVG